ncbi:hypothetical protein ABG067_009010, partial [Albugo candida]
MSSWIATSHPANNSTTTTNINPALESSTLLSTASSEKSPDEQPTNTVSTVGRVPSGLDIFSGDDVSDASRSISPLEPTITATDESAMASNAWLNYTTSPERSAVQEEEENTLIQEGTVGDQHVVDWAREDALQQQQQ